MFSTKLAYDSVPGQLLAMLLASLLQGTAFGQSVLSKAVRTSESMEPALVHPDQIRESQAKLDALKAKTGKRPNIVWLIVDDMGYGDPGAFGGGSAVGAATPNMDRLAREGLKLTATYSQPTCTPTRSAILTGRLPVRTGLTRPILAGDTITKNPWDDEMSLPRILGTECASVYIAASRTHYPVNAKPEEYWQPEKIVVDTSRSHSLRPERRTA